MDVSKVLISLSALVCMLAIGCAPAEQGKRAPEGPAPATSTVKTDGGQEDEDQAEESREPAVPEAPPESPEKPEPVPVDPVAPDVPVVTPSEPTEQQPVPQPPAPPKEAYPPGIENDRELEAARDLNAHARKLREAHEVSRQAFALREQAKNEAGQRKAEAAEAERKLKAAVARKAKLEKATERNQAELAKAEEEIILAQRELESRSLAAGSAQKIADEKATVVAESLAVEKAAQAGYRAARAVVNEINQVKARQVADRIVNTELKLLSAKMDYTAAESAHKSAAKTRAHADAELAAKAKLRETAAGRLAEAEEASRAAAEDAKVKAAKTEALARKKELDQKTVALKEASDVNDQAYRKAAGATKQVQLAQGELAKAAKSEASARSNAQAAAAKQARTQESLNAKAERYRRLRAAHDDFLAQMRKDDGNYEIKPEDGERHSEEMKSIYRAALWSKTKNGDFWTDLMLAEIRATRHMLETARDVNTFCPGYWGASNRLKQICWLRLVGAIVKFESGFNPGDMFWEKSLQRYSIGLWSLSARECALASTEELLKNPVLNLSCGMRMMARYIRRHGVISGEPPRRGAAGYWAVLRKPYRADGYNMGDYYNVLKITRVYAQY